MNGEPNETRDGLLVYLANQPRQPASLRFMTNTLTTVKFTILPNRKQLLIGQMAKSESDISAEETLMLDASWDRINLNWVTLVR